MMKNKHKAEWGKRGKALLAFLFYPSQSPMCLVILMVVIVVLLNLL